MNNLNNSISPALSFHDLEMNTPNSNNQPMMTAPTSPTVQEAAHILRQLSRQLPSQSTGIQFTLQPRNHSTQSPEVSLPIFVSNIQAHTAVHELIANKPHQAGNTPVHSLEGQVLNRSTNSAFQPYTKINKNLEITTQNHPLTPRPTNTPTTIQTLHTPNESTPPTQYKTNNPPSLEPNKKRFSSQKIDESLFLPFNL